MLFRLKNKIFLFNLSKESIKVPVVFKLALFNKFIVFSNPFYPLSKQ